MVKVGEVVKIKYVHGVAFKNLSFANRTEDLNKM
jgi:hypothetical protein